MFGCLPRAAPNITAASRADSSSGGKENKTQQRISETRRGLLTCIASEMLFFSSQSNCPFYPSPEEITRLQELTEKSVIKGRA